MLSESPAPTPTKTAEPNLTNQKQTTKSKSK